MSDKMSIDKKEHSREQSEDSVISTPENGPEPSAQQDAQPVKRKGGRKPIYATSEERKQRNRQAQAAFRERRTEYIKQLEDAIKVHEKNLSNLQTAHRTASEECLMLRYKNSLLERILLEKGIDVQAELQAKTGSPNLGPTHMPPNLIQPPPIQRALLNRHHNSRRSTSSIAPKLEPGVTSMPSHDGQSVTSPKSRSTATSHTASPTNPTGPSFNSQMVSSPTIGVPNHGPVRPLMPPPMKQPMTSMPGVPGNRPAMMQQHHQQPSGPRPPAIYPTASFQSHFQQLEQEYDAPNDTMDDTEPDSQSQGTYSTEYSAPHSTGMAMQQQTQVHAHTHPSQQQPGPTTSEHGGHTQGQAYPSMTQLLDPALDWDPFGLSASMAFPTSQFTFDTSNMR
ncbi:hypothetical protein F5Y16DRAFT_413783 [Xylariaceae sp. FL0255]|nr:hypothetical protein F5Y16DRAFT_413783 [Xylariaceae sp. FL0255]